MRFYRWNEHGVVLRVFLHLRQKNICKLDVIFMDSTTIRAHPDSAGAQKKRGFKASEGLGEV